MSTVAVNTTEIRLGDTVATLTWWHQGWLEYAVRLDTAEGSFEAVEDSWFAALAATAQELALTGRTLPIPAFDGPAENPDEHREQWSRWLAANFG